MGLNCSKSLKFRIFGKKKFAPKGEMPLSDFYRIRRGGGCPKSVPSRQSSRLWILKCGLTGTKIAKIVNFWCKFAPKGYIPLIDFYNKCEIWHEGADLPPAPHAKFHVYRGNVSSLRGEKPILKPRSHFHGAGYGELRSITERRTVTLRRYP